MLDTGHRYKLKTDDKVSDYILVWRRNSISDRRLYPAVTVVQHRPEPHLVAGSRCVDDIGMRVEYAQIGNGLKYPVYILQ
jgi:hypothetical protein